MARKPQVGIIMGSTSDHATLEPTEDTLKLLQIPYEIGVVSAHRTPLDMVAYAKSAQFRGIKVIIACAGGAAHLPGMTASLTQLPVIGLPVRSKTLSGLDSLLSIVQMPPGIPVATVSIDGGQNAALLAAKIIALSDYELAKRLVAFSESLEQKVAQMNEELLTTEGHRNEMVSSIKDSVDLSECTHNKQPEDIR